MDNSKLLSAQQISEHKTPTDCWIVVDGQVWDVTQFTPEHPGGAAIILKYAGRDATKAYSDIHAPSVIRDNLSLDMFKGILDNSTVDEEWTKPPPTESPQVVLDGEKPPLHTMINAHDFEEVAARTASKKTWAFYSSAANDLITRDANKSMFRRIWFRPRVMRDMRVVDTTSQIFGIKVSFPIFIAPTGMAKLIHLDGEMALARAAKEKGILQMVSLPNQLRLLLTNMWISTSASYPLKQIIEAAPKHPFLFQLYVNKDRKKSEQLLQECKTLGIKAIFVTVDAASAGKREADERVKADEDLSSPLSGASAVNDKKGGGLGRVMGGYIDSGLCWDDIKWLRRWTNLPIVLKGIMCAEDAKIAMKERLDGVLLSNHGGRNLDTSPPAILLLLEMHKNCPEIFNRMDVFVDGGIRRGSDILKALCLGATAVGLGRSFLYSLNYGQEGVEHLIDILKDELEVAMRLVGINNLSQVHPGLVNTLDVDHLIPSTPDHPYAKWRPRARL